MNDNTPLGLTAKYDSSSKTTEITWAYLYDADITYFVLEYWDEKERKWKPFDGRNGYIEKDNV